MPIYTTESVSSAIDWLGGCKNLGEVSRTNLVAVLSSAPFRAALHQQDGSKIVIEFEQDEAADCRPRRVLLEVVGHRPAVAITGDRGAWIFGYTAPPV